MYRNKWNISRCIYTSLQIFNKRVSTFIVVWFWQVAKQRPSMLKIDTTANWACVGRLDVG